MLNGQRLDQVKFQIKAIATKRVIFLVQNLKRVGHDFSRAVQRDVRDGRMVDGLRMVAVDVAIAHRGPETLRDGRGRRATVPPFGG